MDMNFLMGMAGCRIAVITIGLIGNVLTFIIFSRPAFKKNSISTYCRALAISDFFTIYELVADIGFLINGDFSLQISYIGCKLYYYAGISLASIPGWILIAFSIDKVLSMKNTAKFIKKRSFQYTVISFIVLFHLLLYIEVPIYLQPVSIVISNFTYVYCEISTLWFGGVFSIMYLMEGTILPFIIMLCTSIISIRLIRNSANNIQRHVTDISNRKSRDFKYAVTSISFNVMFVVLKTPLALIVALENFIPDISLVKIYSLFLFYIINYSSGFFVHLASNSIFRRELMVFLRLRKPCQIADSLSIPRSTPITNKSIN